MSRIYRYLGRRSMSALAALLVFLFGPGTVPAATLRTIDGIGGGDSLEGDPIDSNDYGSAGGAGDDGGGTEVQDEAGLLAAAPWQRAFVIGDHMVLLLPDGRGGLTVLHFVVPGAEDGR